MYHLVTIADVVQIHPQDFHKSSRRAIEDYINAKYADKVIHQVGLCVGFHSLVNASDGLISHGTGIVHVNVEFKLIVFRPFKGEILRGWISNSMFRGCHMSMRFFEDIVVPKEFMFTPSTFEADENGQYVFIWRTEGMEFFYDKLERCSMRVEGEEWTDMSPQMKRPEDYDLDRLDDYDMRVGPYRIIVSMMQTGLGPSAWWLGEEAAAAEDDAPRTDGAADVAMNR